MIECVGMTGMTNTSKRPVNPFLQAIVPSEAFVTANNDTTYPSIVFCKCCLNIVLLGLLIDWNDYVEGYS